MTDPKNKAKELVSKFYDGHTNVLISEAKQFAIIAVDEIINENYDEFSKSSIEAEIAIVKRLEFWQSVRTEITNL